MPESEPQPIDKSLLDRKEAMRSGLIQSIKSWNEQWWNFSFNLGQFEGRDVRISNGDILCQDTDVLEVWMRIPNSELESADYPIVETVYRFGSNRESLGHVSETEFVEKVPCSVPLIVSREFNIVAEIPSLPFRLVGRNIRSDELNPEEFLQVSDMLWDLVGRTST